MTQHQGSSRSAGSATETRSFEAFAGSACAECEWSHLPRKALENNPTPVRLVPEGAFRRPGYGVRDHRSQQALGWIGEAGTGSGGQERKGLGMGES